jgi:hypothetical protein
VSTMTPSTKFTFTFYFSPITMSIPRHTMYITILLPSLAESISTYFTNTMNTCTNFIHPPLKPHANILSKDMVCNLAKITIV